ncbi:helix-turn-helix domain-containing protein [Streptomyces sp. Z26]|uniref:helix-turn-helix domain-containing protein n=1 Tax=Streptomyces sp. Z26 TaxID=2500177 RepID=UPI000EF14836|nr:helix-turn-helix domain-containing protein [Streptomyces sp. Z26]RLL70306.1 helix-turn-helix domain-containing protein [Streptomyces sp. Z26]
MAVNHDKRPVTDDDRQQIRVLHAEGLGRNEIARRLNRSPRTISVQATDMGLTFDRTATAVATAARKTDAKARRAAIIDGLYDVAEDDLAYLKQGAGYELVEVSMGAPVRYTVDRLPAQDRRALIGGINTGTGAAARLEALDAGDGADDARSMIGQLAAGLTAAYHAMNEGDGDAP